MGSTYGCPAWPSLCKNFASVLASFIDPGQTFGPDKIIPPNVLANAKGLIVMTVVKAGSIGPGRSGSGVMVARLADGSWSTQSVVGTVEGGFGGLIGFEMTDFVFIINDSMAITTFAQLGSLALGRDISIAPGPVGRMVGAAGGASTKVAAGIFAYSKVKGLFACASPEGSILIERRDANEKLYSRKVTATELLSGKVLIQPHAEPLMRVLNSPVFSSQRRPFSSDAMYRDISVYKNQQEDIAWHELTGNTHGEGHRGSRIDSITSPNEYSRPSPISSNSRASMWADDSCDHASDHASTFGSLDQNRQWSSTLNDQSDDVYSDKGLSSGQFVAAKPVLAAKCATGPEQAIARFTFNADVPGDLWFGKGDIISIVKRGESENAWWTGRIGDREGIFPSNYVEDISLDAGEVETIHGIFNTRP